MPPLPSEQRSTWPGSNPLAGDRLISRRELNHFIHISDMSLWRWLRAKKFPPPIYIGNRRYWKASDLARWLDAKQFSEAHNDRSS